MYRWFLKVLEQYIEHTEAGKIVIIDFGFRLPLPDNPTIRKPDLAVVLKSNQPLDEDEKTYSGIFDFCLELISDASNESIRRDTVDKKVEYEIAGVKEYYILDASNKHMAFYRLNQQGFFQHIRPINGDIIQSTVLKGFQFRISDLFKQPSLEKTAKEKVYYDFVIPNIKKETEEQRQRADKEKLRADIAEKERELERQRAEKEKLRAEEEKHRAEKEKLRADTAERERELERQRAEQMAEKLRSLGISLE
jgi:hypothetical protein